MRLESRIDEAISEALENKRMRKVRILFEIKVRIKKCIIKTDSDIKSIVHCMMLEKRSLISEMTKIGESKMVIQESLDFLMLKDLIRDWE